MLGYVSEKYSEAAVGGTYTYSIVHIAGSCVNHIDLTHLGDDTTQLDKILINPQIASYFQP